MKTVYINSNVLEEGVLMKALPDDIVATIDRNRTSFGTNPAFPNVFDRNFIEILSQKRFDELSDKLHTIGSIDIVKSDKPSEALAELMNMAIEIEKPFRQQLEKICFNAVVEFFGIPNDMLNLEIELTSDISVDGTSFQVEKLKDMDTEYDSFGIMEEFTNEVHKRMVINALCIGCGMEVSANIGKFAGELYDINPRLPEIYRDILLLNSYLLFHKEDLGMSDKNQMQSGTVEIRLGSDEEKVSIKAQGKIFPILLCETIRGIMELFSTHGLPKDVGIMREVLQRSDYLKAEQWAMRIGPELWKLITNSIGDFKTTMLPYIFTRICKLDLDSFNRLMKSVFARTKEGKQLMASIVGAAEEDFAMNGDDDRARKQDIDKSVITDEFLHEEEL